MIFLNLLLTVIIFQSCALHQTKRTPYQKAMLASDSNDGKTKLGYIDTPLHKETGIRAVSFIGSHKTPEHLVTMYALARAVEVCQMDADRKMQVLYSEN